MRASSKAASRPTCSRTRPRTFGRGSTSATSLRLGEQPFALTVRNGLRTAGGAPYGSGAHYTIEYDGNVYEYVLGEFGWDSTIEAIVDLDGDGKPDFIIAVGGDNSGYEAILLSSKATPGRNVPTASLLAHGC